MNDETPETFDTVGDAAVEARIVAWVLGEASAFEIAELERLCAERPELEVFRRRMLSLDGLLMEAEGGAGDQLVWKLPAEKRQVVDELAGEAESMTVAVQKEARISRSGRRAFFAMAACVMVTFFITVFYYGKLVQPARVAEMEKRVDFMPPSGGGEPIKVESANLTQEDKGAERRRALARREWVSEPQVESSVVAPEARPAPSAALADEEAKQVAGTNDGFNGQSEFTANGLSNGLRSGDQAINRNNIDAILNNPSRTRALAKEVPSEPQLPASPPVLADMAAGDSFSEAPAAGAGTGNGFGAGSGLADGHGKNGWESGPEELSRFKKSEAESLSRFAGAEGGGLAESAGKDSKTREPRARVGKEMAASKKPASATAQPPVLGAKQPAAAAPDVVAEAKVQVPNLQKDVQADSAPAEEHAQNVDKVRRGLYTAEGNFNLGKYDDAKKEYEDVLRTDPYNAAARRGLERVSSAKSDYYRAAYDHTRAELLSEVDKAWELTVPEEKDFLKDSGPEEVVLEKAESVAVDPFAEPAQPKAKAAMPAKLQQQPLVDFMEEIAANDDPYSTFSLNISDASFQVAKAALAKGERPDPGGIKPEQFYNAVDYGDPAPASNEPVAATIEQSANPVVPGRNLVRVAVRTGSTGRPASQPLRLTLLVDQSGSMVRDDRRTSMEQALQQLAGLLTAQDKVTVVGFSRTPHLLADGLSGDQGGKLSGLVNQAASEGGTNLEEAMKLGAEMAARHKLDGAQNRVVLFTDGAANLGDADPDHLAEQVKALRQKGIAFDIAGIAANDLNDRLLSELARHGNGRYYVVGDAKSETFAKQLAGAFRPAAENVKIQVNFNPDRVGRYKLIGFEKDRLKTEDFRNDAVDAAELAADEAGVAIYQVEPLPEGKGELGEVSVRFRDTNSGEMVERTWTVPYEATAPAFDRANPSMQLAGLSMLAAQKLRGGPLAEAIDFKQLAAPAASVKQILGGNEGVAEMLQVIDALK